MLLLLYEDLGARPSKNWDEWVRLRSDSNFSLLLSMLSLSITRRDWQLGFSYWMSKLLSFENDFLDLTVSDIIFFVLKSRLFLSIMILIIIILII